MAKTKKEEVVESTTEKVVEETTKQPESNETKGDVTKVLKKMSGRWNQLVHRWPGGRGGNPAAGKMMLILMLG